MIRILSLILFPSAQSKYILTMTNLVCKGNPKYITFHVYKINAIRRGVQKLYYNYTFMTRVEEMWTEFQTFKRYGNVYQPFVIKWDPESCKSKALLLEKPSVNNVGMMLLQTIVKDESGCHPCPMLAGESCGLDGWEVNGDFMPPFMPTGGYKMKIKLHDVAGQNYATIEIFCKVSTTQ